MGLNYDWNLCWRFGRQQRRRQHLDLGGLATLRDRACANLGNLARSRSVPLAGLHAHRKCDPSAGLHDDLQFGQVFEGSINSQHRITGQVTGYCSYDLTWQKAELSCRAGVGSGVA